MSLNTTFITALGLTLFVYFLRGFGILTFIPGGIIWILILVSLVLGIWVGIEKTRRF